MKGALQREEDAHKEDSEKLDAVVKALDSSKAALQASFLANKKGSQQ